MSIGIVHCVCFSTIVFPRGVELMARVETWNYGDLNFRFLHWWCDVNIMCGRRKRGWRKPDLNPYFLDGTLGPGGRWKQAWSHWCGMRGVGRWKRGEGSLSFLVRLLGKMKEINIKIKRRDESWFRTGYGTFRIHPQMDGWVGYQFARGFHLSVECALCAAQGAWCGASIWYALPTAFHWFNL